MKRQTILEYRTPDVEVLEEKKVSESSEDREIQVRVTWQQAGTINNNNRRYRRELLEREVRKIMERINRGETVWGCAYHPSDGLGETSDVTHKWNRVWIDEKGHCGGDLTVLPTQKGKDIQTLIKNGKIGLSSRGFGTVTETKEKVGGKEITFLDVNDDYDLVSPGDWVISPSVTGTGNEKVMEEMRILEEQFNKASSLEDISNGRGRKVDKKVKKIESIEALREAYPDLVIEAKKDELEKELDEAVKEKAAKLADDLKETYEATIKEKDEAIKVRDEKFTSFVSDYSALEGVIPEDQKKDEDTKGSGDNDEKKKIEKLEKKLKTIEEEKKKLEEEKQDRELQEKLSSKLDKELEKDEYKNYAVLVKKDLLSEDGRINIIGSEEEVEEVVKATYNKISNYITEAKKANAKKSGFDEKGHIKDPEGESKENKEEKEIKDQRQFQEAVNSGYKGTFEEFKKDILGE